MWRRIQESLTLMPCWKSWTRKCPTTLAHGAALLNAEPQGKKKGQSFTNPTPRGSVSPSPATRVALVLTRAASILAVVEACFRRLVRQHAQRQTRTTRRKCGLQFWSMLHGWRGAPSRPAWDAGRLRRARYYRCLCHNLRTAGRQRFKPAAIARRRPASQFAWTVRSGVVTEQGLQTPCGA